ncbi:MAG: DUF1292 domain-containing protein [Lachnospiraceae bacterium]|nr:DUF1292 domain-containing protein [Lachnospiraceae bacterium]
MNKHNEGCNCGNHEEEALTVTLTLDNDEVVECSVLTIYKVEDREYIALLPLDDNGDNEEGDVFIYRFTQDGEDGEPTLDNIEDDDEYEAAADAFDEWLDEQEFEELDDEE